MFFIYDLNMNLQATRFAILKLKLAHQKRQVLNIVGLSTKE